MIKPSNRQSSTWILRWIDCVTYGKGPNLNWILATFWSRRKFWRLYWPWPGRKRRKDIFHLYSRTRGTLRVIPPLTSGPSVTSINCCWNNRHCIEIKSLFVFQKCYDLMAAAAGCRLHHFRRNWKFWIVFCRQIFLLNATIFQGFKVFIFKPWFIHAFSISSSPNKQYLPGHYLNVFFWECNQRSDWVSRSGIVLLWKVAWMKFCDSDCAVQ